MASDPHHHPYNTAHAGASSAYANPASATGPARHHNSQQQAPAPYHYDPLTAAQLAQAQATHHAAAPAHATTGQHPTVPSSVADAKQAGSQQVAQQQQQQQQQDANNGVQHTQDQIGWYFVEQYYTTLSREPEKLHLYHNKQSQFCFGDEAEKVPVAVGPTEIQSRIRSLNFRSCKVRVLNVDAQGSFENILVIVIGEISNDGQPSRKFVQTFVLAQQPNGYYVLNDVFRYMKDEEEVEEEPTEEKKVEKEPVKEEPAAEERPLESAVEAAPPEKPETVTTPADVEKVDERLEEEEKKEAKEAKEEQKEGEAKEQEDVEKQSEQQLEEKEAKTTEKPAKEEETQPELQASGDEQPQATPSGLKEPEHTPAVVEKPASPTQPPANAAPEAAPQETPAQGEDRKEQKSSAPAANAGAAAAPAPARARAPAPAPAPAPVKQSWADIASRNAAAAAAPAAAPSATAVKPAAPAPAPAPTMPKQGKSTAAAPSAPAAAPATNGAPRQSPAATPSADEWQTVPGGHHDHHHGTHHHHARRQTGRSGSGSGPSGGPGSKGDVTPVDENNTLAYVRGVTERVDASLLRETMSRFGPLKDFDVSRSRNCAFIEFATPAAYRAAVAANPHTIGTEQVTVAVRRVKNMGGSGARGHGRGGMRSFGRGGGSQGRAQGQSQGQAQAQGVKRG
ncbi:hypothetical protein KEM55_003059 [Ascosphaera atra]|nr:hypothetical protein KEM55_003059 [Ascosphaera atra]